jgi:hypothetical protein
VRSNVDQYRNDATALATEPGARFRVDVRDVDAETFGEVASLNEGVRGMASAAVRDDDGELLFIDHEDYGGWVFPGGGVEAGETFPEAVDAEPCADPGLDDECITDVRWTSTVSDRLPDDSTVRRTVQCATAEFETVSRA